MVEFRDTIAFLERREAVRQQALDRRFADAWEDFHRVVAMIIQRYGPRAIWQRGSLLERRTFSEFSDIDIALEGLGSADRIFRVVEDAEETARFPLDIVEMEKIEPEYAALIRRKGKVVYGDIRSIGPNGGRDP